MKGCCWPGGAGGSVNSSVCCRQLDLPSASLTFHLLPLLLSSRPGPWSGSLASRARGRPWWRWWGAACRAACPPSRSSSRRACRSRASATSHTGALRAALGLLRCCWGCCRGDGGSRQAAHADLPCKLHPAAANAPLFYPQPCPPAGTTSPRSSRRRSSTRCRTSCTATRGPRTFTQRRPCWRASPPCLVSSDHGSQHEL